MSQPTALGKTANKAFNHLVNMLGPDGYIKLNNAPDTYMPLSIEKIDDVNGYSIYSFCHYYEQNGDLVQDPEMTFARCNQYPELIYPLTYYLPMLEVNQVAGEFKEDGRFYYKYKLMKDLAQFANTWFKNIIVQQEIKIN